MPKLICSSLINSLYCLLERVKLSFVNTGQDSYIFTKFYADYNLWAVIELQPHREFEPFTFNFSRLPVDACQVRTLRAGYQDTSVAEWVSAAS